MLRIKVLFDPGQVPGEGDIITLSDYN